MLAGRQHVRTEDEESAEDVTLLTSRDEEFLMRAIEFSLPIRKREQFFLWSQGVLQALIPHEILFCALVDVGEKKCFATERFTARPFPEVVYQEICGAPNGLLLNARSAWDQCGHSPLLICPHKGPSWLLERFGEAIKRYELTNCAVHGMPSYGGAPGSFFCFARLPGQLGRRQGYLLDIVLPYLHVAFVRTLRTEQEVALKKIVRAVAEPVGSALQQSVTSREVQILQGMCEGKSNREIGDILKISQFTVKNHVQSILKKLKVKNRTQAVSFAITSRLIHPNDGRS